MELNDLVDSNIKLLIGLCGLNNAIPDWEYLREERSLLRCVIKVKRF